MEGGFLMDLDFKKNIGNFDRIFRVAVGVLFIALALLKVVTGGWAIAATVFGLVQVAEGVLGY